MYIYIYIYICMYVYVYIYMIITKKSPSSILRHLRVVNSAFLKQRFDGCLFHFIKVYTYYTL